MATYIGKLKYDTEEEQSRRTVSDPLLFAKEPKNYKLSWETSCRESLCGVLGNGIYFSNKLHKVFPEITIMAYDTWPTESFINEINKWLLKKYKFEDEQAIWGQDDKLFLRSPTVCSKPMISTLAFLLNYFGSYFKVDRVSSLVESILDDPMEFDLEFADDALYTAFYIWLVQNRWVSHQWATGFDSNGPASFVTKNFYWYYEDLKDFSQLFSGSIHYLLESHDTDGFTGIFWETIGDI